MCSFRQWYFSAPTWFQAKKALSLWTHEEISKALYFTAIHLQQHKTSNGWHYKHALTFNLTWFNIGVHIVLTSSFLYSRKVLRSFSFRGFSFWPRSFRNVATDSGFFAILMSRTNSAWVLNPSNWAFWKLQTVVKSSSTITGTSFHIYYAIAIQLV